MEHTDARAAGGVERHGAGLFDRVRPPHTAAMGISSLLPSLRSIVRTKHVGEAYGGKRVAVDSYCWLHRGAYSCSVELVEGIPTDKFVTSFMKRAHMLRRCDVEAVYVFDGGRMPGKADEEADRRRARVEAKQKARAHKRAGNEVAANEMYQRAVDVSPEMALAVIEAHALAARRVAARSVAAEKAAETAEGGGSAGESGSAAAFISSLAPPPRRAAAGWWPPPPRHSFVGLGANVFASSDALPARVRVARTAATPTIVGALLPAHHIIREIDFEHAVQHVAALRALDRHQHLDSALEVARHQVGR